MANDADLDLFYARALIECVVPSTAPDLPPGMVVQLINTALPRLDKALETAKVMLEARRTLEREKMQYQASIRQALQSEMTNETASHQPSSSSVVPAPQQQDTPSAQTTYDSHTAPTISCGNQEEPEEDTWETYTARRPKSAVRLPDVPSLSPPQPAVSSATATRDATPARDIVLRKVTSKEGFQQSTLRPAPPSFIRGATIYNKPERIPPPSAWTRGSDTTARKGDAWETVSYRTIGR